MSESNDKWETRLLVTVEIDRSEAEAITKGLPRPILNQAALQKLDDVLRGASLDVEGVKVSLRGIEGQENTAYEQVVVDLVNDCEGAEDLLELALDGLRRDVKAECS